MRNAFSCLKVSESRYQGYLILLVVYCLMLLVPTGVKSQTVVVANEATITTPGDNRYEICFLLPCNFGPNVIDASHAQSDNNQFARLYASPGLLADLGSYRGGIELTFPQDIPADQWSYVRIGANERLLRALLGGSLGEALGSVLGAVLLGNQEIEIEARHNTTSILTRTNTQGFDTDRVRLVKGADGSFYIAIKPEEAYNKIRITNQSSSLAGLLQEYRLDVYSAVSYTNDPQACGAPLFTSFDGGSGLGVQVADLDNQHLERAIDGDPDTYSLLKSSGVLDLGVARSLSQYFYFNTQSTANHTFNIKLGFASAGAANLDLLGGLQVIAWDGDQAVYTKTLSSGLLNGLNVLELFDNPQNAATLTFAPGKAFDRVEVRLNSVVDLNLIGNGVHIYDVQRYSGAPGCVNPEIIDPPVTPFMLSQKNCAAEVISSAYADFATNTVDGKNDTYATLQTSSGLAAGVGAYSGHVEMGFATEVPAQTTTYVRIDFEDGVLDQLLDGTVGDILGGTLDNVLLGRHYFVVQAKVGNSVVFSRASNNGFNNSGPDAVGVGDMKIVQDKNGHYYVAVTSNTAFSSIRVTERLSATVGLATTESMRVYHACYAIGSDDCEQGFATYSESDGISLDALGLGQAGVANAEFAIDGDEDTGSTISAGAVGVSQSVLQYVQFHGLSGVNDHFRIKMSMLVQGVVSADLIGSIVIKAYDGDNEVYSQRLNEQLTPNLDLLNLLANGQLINIPIAPGKAFDRVAVGIASLVSANVLTSPLQLFSVERFSADCLDPELSWPPKTDSPFNQADCGTSVVDFEHVNFPLEAVNNHPTSDTYATLSAGAGVAGGLGGYSSHLELKYPTVIDAHEVSYIRIDSENNLFESLLGGSLGSDLAGLLGAVALGDQYIRVILKDAAGSPIGAPLSSQSGLNSELFKVVKDTDGRFYLAVTAAQDYQSVRIEYHHTALVGAMGSSSINIYSMCRETEFDLCEQATFTSWDGSGIALDITGLTDGGVGNPEFAIDGNNSNYSTLNLGVVGVGATVSQTIYFKSKSEPTDELRVRLQLHEQSILGLDLLGGARLKLYDGEELVYNELLSTGLINNLDLLGLFRSGGVQTLTFAPGVEYDRAKLEITSVVALNTSAPVRFYGMSRLSADCPDPDFMAPPYRAPVCADVVETGNGDTYAVDDIANAVDGNHNTYATIRSGAGVILGVGAVEGKLTMGYQADAPAGSISYIHVSEDSGLLDALLSGSLGDVVGGLVNGILLGNHQIVVDVQDASGASISSATNRIVQDDEGRYYIAVTADSDYRRVVITTSTNAIVGLNTANALHVHGMCYETNFDGCAEAVTTSWDGSGLAVGMTGIGDYGVVDAFKALDNNNNSDYSTLSLGTLNVAGHIQQNIQFNKILDANSLLRVQMSVGSGQVDATVFGDMRLVAYKAGQEVYNQTIENAVIGNVNLAQLFDNGAVSEIICSPDVDFDEVALRLDALAGASAVVPNVRLYYVVADCDVPVFDAWKSYADATGAAIAHVTGGEEITYTIHIQNTGTADLTDYIVTDAVPTNTTYVAGSGGVLDNGEVTFSGVNVAAGATETVSFKALVDADLTGIDKISNVAVVKLDAADPGKGTVPPADPANPTAPDPNATPGTPTDIPVQAINTIDLSLTGVSNGTNSGQAVPNDVITYTVTITNTGNQDLTNVQLVDPIPVNTTLDDEGDFTQNGANLELTIPTLAVGDTETYTFTVTVNSIDPSLVPSIDNSVTASNPVVSETATHSMPTDCTPLVAANLSLSSSVSVLCAGESVTLTAALVGAPVGVTDNMVKWYGAYNGGAVSGYLGEGLSLVHTPAQTGNVTYFAVIEGIAFCFNNPPALVSVTVNALPSTPTITANSTTVCEGEGFVLTATGGATNYRWFKGVDELVGQTSNTLTIASALLTDAGQYTVIAVNATSCESAASAAVTIAVTPRATADDIDVTGDENAVCEGTAVMLTASTSVANPVFRWYSDAALTDEIHVGATLEITPLATTIYYVTVSGDQVCENSVSEAKAVPVTVNPTPDYTVTGDLSYGIEVGNSVTLPTITSAAATITWYDDAGNLVTGATTRQFNAVGTYTYTAVITQADHCTVTLSVLIKVFAAGECPPVFSRVYATESSFDRSLLGSVTDAESAADGDLGTHSTISEGLNVIGILGQTSQTLGWAASVQAGTPVSVKLAKNFNVANVLGSLRLVAVDANGEAVSTVQDIEPKLVNAVSGLNIYEHTFTPADENGQAVAYSGVKVYIAGIVNLAESANIYEAYYHEAGTVDCGAEEVFDVLHGIENPISLLNLASGLIGVSDEENAVDGDPATYATMNNLAAVNAQTRLEVLYNTPALAGDQVIVDLSRPNGLLTVQALQSFTIQPFLGSVPVGPPVANDGVTLNIELLGDGSTARLTYTANQAFDRIKILYGGVADVLSQLRVNEISRQVPTLVTGDNGDNIFAICEGGDITITPPDDCTTYIIYDGQTGGTVVDITALGVGTHTLYVQTVRFGTCEVGSRTEIEVIVSAIPVAPVVVDQILCQTATAAMVEFDVTALTGHSLVFYADANTTTPLTALPTVNSAIVGTTTVYVSQLSGNSCESPRVPVRITVDRTAIAGDITVSDVTICEGQSVVLTASSSTVNNPVFRFYADAALTQEITDLTVRPSIATSYYVTVSGDGVCANSVGAAAVINVGVTVIPAPTIDNATPIYCISDGRTLADLPVVGTGIKWYATLTGGVALPGTTLLQDGVTYYATQMGVSCESVARLAVTPVVEDCEVVLSITKEADDDRVTAGENTSFTLTIRNNGPGIIEVGDVIILEDIPSVGLEITGFSIANNYGSITRTGNTATIIANNIVAVNGTITVNVTAKVHEDAPATISNKIQVWGPDTPPGDDPDGEDETPPIPVDRESKLSITKVADEERVKAGEQTTFTITVTNDGPSAIEAGKIISLLERPGEGVTIDSYEMISNNATVAGSGNTAVLTTTSEIAVNGTIVLRIVATVDHEAPEFITNGITVWGPEKDPEDDPEDDEDDPDPIPVDYPLVEANDDLAEVKAGKTVTISVLLNDVVTKWDIDPATVEIVQQPTLGEVEVLPNGEVVFTAPQDYLGEVQFKYTVKDVKGRRSNEALVTINVIENPLEIPNVITPNGDKVNDAFVIRGLELYDRVHLTIMNRWGNEVYKNNAYNNEWMGIGLNEGTYFYVLELMRDGKVTKYTGSILIKRN